MKSFHRNAARGFALVEILLVLGVIAMLMIAAFVIYPQIKASIDAKALLEEIRLVTVGLKQFNGGRIPSITPRDAAKSGIVPQYMATTHPVFLRSALGKDVYVSVSTTNGVNFWNFQYRDITTEVCIKILPELIRTTALGDVRVTGGGTIRSGNNLQTMDNKTFACNLAPIVMVSIIVS